MAHLSLNIFAVYLVVVLSGCVTTPRMSLEYLNGFQIDCAMRAEQLSFLQSQLVSNDERVLQYLQISGPLGGITSALSGTYRQKKAMQDGTYNGFVRQVMRDVENAC